MTTGDIGFLIFIWVFVGFWTWLIAVAEAEKPLRIALGTALLWPLLLAIFAVRGGLEALGNAIDP